MSHVIIFPIVLPLLAGALSLLLLRRRAEALPALNLGSCVTLLLVSLWILADAATGRYGVYALGEWPAPFGIVLVQDRLSALMLVLTSFVALCSLLYALAGELRRDPYFHLLFQFQLLGLNGAFLTGDLFNLFVFFEILLIASYGLLLRGQGATPARTRATLHYVVLNLAGSLLFLIAVAVIYSVVGTLNMADLALRVAQARPEDAALLRSGALLLLVVFALKAALLPLYFWLPAAYSSAAAPVAALFAIMTKVGVYAILRVYTLIFGEGAGVAAGVAEAWLLPAAVATIALAAVGALASRRLRQLVSYLVIVSVGMLLAGVGLFSQAGIAGALYYLLHTTMLTVCLYLLADLIARGRAEVEDQLYPGPAVPQATLLGAVFLLSAMAMAGLPPLSGFLGKVFVLKAAADHDFLAVIWGVVLVGSLFVIIALSRAGSVLFWKTAGPGEAPRISPLALTAALLPLLASPALVVFVQPVQDYAAATALQLLVPDGYIAAVLNLQGAAIIEQTAQVHLP